MKAVPAMAAALLLAACQRPTTADPDVISKTWHGGVARAAQAPDGTTLWVTRWGGEYVFFAASGASWQTHRTETTTDGKGHTSTRTITEDHAVPTGDGIAAASRAWSE
ncbi:hypothetical protein GG804_26270 [Sphingomonas histidinilytica]|uniref:hypothetical protein n=1 Tax=Rhizorhabdus histidinilytica TaxID=439228 RepID=UPI001AD9932F|nr:hypothetical protein [Rhizorhabdus histidinilytica]MBO9380275.1 hypothetical protein [Rhizorhabdus histidinilytica]